MNKKLLTLISAAAFAGISQAQTLLQESPVVYLVSRVSFSDENGIRNFEPGTICTIVQREENKIILASGSNQFAAQAQDFTEDQEKGQAIADKLKQEREK